MTFEQAYREAWDKFEPPMGRLPQSPGPGGRCNAYGETARAVLCHLSRSADTSSGIARAMGITTRNASKAAQRLKTAGRVRVKEFVRGNTAVWAIATETQPGASQ